MAQKKLKDISAVMRKLDICMMTTSNGKGKLSSRPMSNNGDVEYDGNSWYFTYEGTQKIKDIEDNENVDLTFAAKDDLYLSITGKGKLIRQRAKMEDHWVESLNQWFENGLDTKGIVLIHVKASTIKYWQREDQGEINVE